MTSHLTCDDGIDQKYRNGGFDAVLDPYSENILITSGKWREEREYWLNNLGPAVEPSGFTPDLRDMGNHESVRTEVRYMVPANLTSQVLSICRHSDQGIYAFMLSGIFYLLRRYTGDGSVIIGMPNSGQESMTKTNGITAIKADINEDKTFKEYLLYVNQVVQEARKYKHIPFSTIIRMLKGDQEAPIPSFRTIVALNTLHTPDQYMDVQADMLFEFIKTDDSIQVGIHYDRTLYSLDFVNGICCHFIGYLEELLLDTDIVLKHIRLLSMQERVRIERQFNDTDSPSLNCKTIHELIDKQAAKTPDLIAVSFGNQHVTYRELIDKSNRLATLIRNKGFQRNQIAAVIVNRSIEMMLAILAVLKAGGAYLPIDPTYPSDRIKYMLDDSNTNLLLTQSSLGINDFWGEVVDITDEQSYPEFQETLPDDNHPEDRAYMIYTSGSTGQPKGVLIPHRAVLNFFKGMADRIAFEEGKSIASVTTMSFDIFVLETLLPLTRGMRVVIAGEEEQHHPGLLKIWMARNQIDMLQATPSRIQILLNDKQDNVNLDRISDIMVGGEAFPNELLNQLQDRFDKAKIYNMYGPTETTIWSSVKEVTTAKSVNLGTPIANTRMFIIDELSRLVPVGVAGELCIAGDGVALGYWKNDILNVERFIDCPFTGGGTMYRTGDMARWLPNGELECLGRIDYQVKIRGHRVELGEVESALLQIEFIRAAVCTAMNDREGHKLICAYYVSSQPVTADMIRGNIAANLPEYMLPSFYINLDKIPYTPNGKVDRKLLPDPYSMTCILSYEPPANKQEEKLLEIWKQVLGVDEIGVIDDFFNVGGHSLLALKLEVELEKAGLSFDAEDLYRYPTIRGFIQRLEIGDNTGSSKLNTPFQARPSGMDLHVQTTVAHQDRIVPFNELFYKECFYNSLFPVISYYNRDILPVILNDTIIYRYDPNIKHFTVDYELAKPLEELLNDLGIRMKTKVISHSIVDELKMSIRGNNPAIIRIDCYYASTRADTYQKKHWPHSWLVYGYDDSKGMFAVIEHDRIENLTYEKRLVSYDDTVLCYNGYLEIFGLEKPGYYEFSAEVESEINSFSLFESNLQKLESWASSEKIITQEGLNNLENFVMEIQKTLFIEKQVSEVSEDVIDALNQILNAKIVEKYCLEQMFIHSEVMKSKTAEIMRMWKQIRDYIAKSIFSKRVSPKSKIILKENLETVCELERQYYTEMFDLLNKAVHRTHSL